MTQKTSSTYARQMVLFPLMCFCLFFSLMAFEYVLPYRDTNDYIFAFLDKLNLLKSETDAPRIIFLGGSNVAFGLNSGEIEKELHRRVINMGLEVGLGMKFIMDSAMPYFRKGDVVVLSFEYNNYYGDIFYGDYGLLCLLENVFPEGEKYVNVRQGYVLLTNMDNFLVDSLKRKLRYFIVKDKKMSSCYDRRAFNKYGDDIFPLTDKHQNHKFAVYKADASVFQSEALDYLDNYRTDLESRGVKVFYLYPPIQKSTYLNQLTNIREVKKKLSLSAINSDILNTPEDGVLADDLFYDSPYHLNKAGRSIHTREVISLLRKRMFSNVR